MSETKHFNSHISSRIHCWCLCRSTNTLHTIHASPLFTFMCDYATLSTEIIAKSTVRPNERTKLQMLSNSNWFSHIIMQNKRKKWHDLPEKRVMLINCLLIKSICFHLADILLLFFLFLGALFILSLCCCAFEIRSPFVVVAVAFVFSFFLRFHWISTQRV